MTIGVPTVEVAPDIGWRCKSYIALIGNLMKQPAEYSPLGRLRVAAPPSLHLRLAHVMRWTDLVHW
ncbi:hypothetical protein Q644_02010 [Brucella intermedia 229E]|uniref:Uncharacterized protein n=1 Tax=Brucella intermedia 229E TaxID=1337887 RepID=U4VIE4_9HYPH|nr:hypothetical protein Q644_02010 [Brucella intermedia 229E]